MAHTSVYDGRQLGNIWIDILRNPLPQVCVHLLSLTTPGGEGRRGREERGGGGEGEGSTYMVVHVQLGR